MSSSHYFRIRDNGLSPILSAIISWEELTCFYTPCDPSLPRNDVQSVKNVLIASRVVWLLLLFHNRFTPEFDLSFSLYIKCCCHFKIRGHDKTETNRFFVLKPWRYFRFVIVSKTLDLSFVTIKNDESVWPVLLWVNNWIGKSFMLGKFHRLLDFILL